MLNPLNHPGAPSFSPSKPLWKQEFVTGIGGKGCQASTNSRCPLHLPPRALGPYFGKCYLVALTRPLSIIKALRSPAEKDNNSYNIEPSI